MVPKNVCGGSRRHLFHFCLDVWCVGSRGFPKKLKGWEDPQAPRRSYLLWWSSPPPREMAPCDCSAPLPPGDCGLLVAGVRDGVMRGPSFVRRSADLCRVRLGLIEPIDAEQLRGEEEPKDLDRGARGGHLQEVTSLDALPSSAFVLSASLDRSLALWKAIQGADTLQLQRCIVLGHSIMSAILVRSRNGLDAVLADGARVAREPRRGPTRSIHIRERVTTPHKIMKEVSVSSENDTVLTASRTAARDVRCARLFDESAPRRPSPQPQLSVEGRRG